MKQNKQRKRALPITALFVDIGGVLLTNGKLSKFVSGTTRVFRLND